MKKQSENNYLYHYFERDFGPFMSLTALAFEEAKQILMAQKQAGKFHNPDIDGFLQKRYDRDTKLRDVFIAHGGKPKRITPIYMMLGEHNQWESAYENPAVIKIPLDEFDPLTVSFTYGDSFAVFNPVLFGKEEYWNRIYFSDEILAVIEQYGFPTYVEYDFKRGIYPKDKNINHHLKYVEAHVWDDTILNTYRNKWTLQKNVKLRNYKPDDCKEVYKLFYDTIHSINATDYNESQLDSWAPKDIDFEHWNKRLLRNDYSVVAEKDGIIVGIGTADDTGYFDSLYVHKDYQRIGVATLIADDLERYIGGKGSRIITTDASITTRPFFEKRGYVVQAEQSVECRGQYLTNYKMQKSMEVRK